MGTIDFVNQRIRGEEKKYSPVGAIYDTAQSIGYMTPSLFLGGALGNAGVPANIASKVSSGAFGAAMGGNAYSEALNKGNSVEKAQLYGLAQGVDEAATNYLLGGISGFGGGKLYPALAKTKIGSATLGTLSKWLPKLVKTANGQALIKQGAKYLGSMGAEALQEYVQNYTEKGEDRKSTRLNSSHW